MAETKGIDRRAFRDSVGEFATGVTVVSTIHEGTPAGMTLNAFTSVSLDPLLVLVCLGHGSRTLGAVQGAGRLAISVLHRGQGDVALAFATSGGPFPAEHMRETHDGFLVVRDAAATYHCDVAEITRAGDHDVVVCRVTEITHSGGDPLVFHRGRFGGLAPDTIVPPGYAISVEEGAGW